jgi:hydrophobic/amphiphilic exporter-1 (mainly G- bacteria), HAE1 family
MRAVIAAALKRPTATLMVFAGIMILGAAAAMNLRLELLPDLTIPRLTVSTAYPGLPAAEVRSLITIPLEDQLASVKGVRRVSSVSRDSLSIISLEFAWGEDMVAAAVRTREGIDVAYTALPADAAKPQVLPGEVGEQPVAIVAVRPRAGDLPFARRLGEREIKTRLQQVDGVGSVLLCGGAVEEVVVSVEQSLMASRGLSLNDIASLVAKNNYDYPTGTVTQGGREFMVKAVGTVTDPADLGSFRFPGARSGLRLSDLARISLEPRERVSVFQVNGAEAVGLSVMKRKGASPLQVSDGVRAEVERLRGAYGKDLDIAMVSDGSRFISASLGSLAFSTLAGSLIAFLVLVFFLREVRTPALLMLSLPIAVTVTLLALQAFGRTVNIMSLGGLALAIGMVVDNNVVILENLQKRHLGMPATADSVLRHTLELAASRLGATLTLAVVFLPIIFLPGLLGALFTDLSLSVIFAQAASFLTSITLMPVLFLLLERSGGTRQEPRVRAWSDRVFRGALVGTFRKPWITAAAVALFTVIGAACIPLLGFDFMPAQDTGEVDVTITMPWGTDLERTAATAADAQRAALGVPGVARVFARAGGEPEDAQYYADPEERREIIHLHVATDGKRSHATARVAEALRSTLTVESAQVQVALPGSLISPLLGLGGSGRGIVVKGSTQAEAQSRGRTVVSWFATGGRFEGLATRVSCQPEGERSEVRLVPDRDAVTLAGLTLSDVAEAVRNAITGSYPSRLSLEGRDMDVRVRLERREASQPEDLPSLVVGAPGDAPARLSELVRMSAEPATPALYRRDRADAVIVNVEAAAGRQKPLTGEIRGLEGKYPWLKSVEGSVLAENLSSLLAAFALVIVLLYLVLGAQFESFFLPALLLTALPLSFSGICAALAISGKPVSLDSALGIIVLFAVAVNNSIILYETYSARLRSGVPLVAAVYQGTADRMRPIVITMLITVLSLLPIAVDISRTSAESGMAVAIIGGLLVSTILTLFVLPRLFIAYFRGRERRGH